MLARNGVMRTETPGFFGEQTETAPRGGPPLQRRINRSIRPYAFKWQAAMDW